MNAVLVPDREVAASRKPRSLPGLTPAEELARVIAATPHLFRIQFVGAAPDGEPITLTEVEIQVADASRQPSSPPRISLGRLERKDCAFSMAKAAKSLHDRRPIAEPEPDETTHNRVFLDALEMLIDATEHGE